MRELVALRFGKMPLWAALAVSFCGAVLTALCAKISFLTPFSPIPVTMQVFAVLICGLLLGSKIGFLAQLQYIAAGLLGAPIFSGGIGGPAIFAGPTAGYILGFAAAAYIVGLLAERSENQQLISIYVISIVGVVVIYTFGLGWFSIWLTATGWKSSQFSAFAMGILPFIAVDAIKAGAASLIYKSWVNHKIIRR